MLDRLKNRIEEVKTAQKLRRLDDMTFFRIYCLVCEEQKRRAEIKKRKKIK